MNLSVLFLPFIAVSIVLYVFKLLTRMAFYVLMGIFLVTLVSGLIWPQTTSHLESDPHRLERDSKDAKLEEIRLDFF